VRLSGRSYRHADYGQVTQSHTQRLAYSSIMATSIQNQYRKRNKMICAIMMGYVQHLMHDVKEAKQRLLDLINMTTYQTCK